MENVNPGKLMENVNPGKLIRKHKIKNITESKRKHLINLKAKRRVKNKIARTSRKINR